MITQVAIEYSDLPPGTITNFGTHLRPGLDATIGLWQRDTQQHVAVGALVFVERLRRPSIVDGERCVRPGIGRLSIAIASVIAFDPNHSPHTGRARPFQAVRRESNTVSAGRLEYRLAFADLERVVWRTGALEYHLVAGHGCPSVVG
ncbi:hypothetical protein BBD46_05005 [Natrialba sp. SSL1]|nr:hypothetical protein BBD46_05005 [Natrialba sp. SSL1]